MLLAVNFFLGTEDVQMWCLEVESTCCSRWGMSSSPSHLLWSLCLELRNAGVIVVLGDAGCRVNTYPHVWELLNHGLNLWFTTWGEHWVSCGSTGEGNSPVWPAGVELGSTSPRPHLRADFHWGRISSWRLLLGEFLWAYDTSEYLPFISDYLFQHSILTSLTFLCTV